MPDDGRDMNEILCPDCGVYPFEPCEPDCKCWNCVTNQQRRAAEQRAASVPEKA